jgi:hypothetical protein
MWCSSCRADVAAELSTDNRRMLCARCQSELGVAAFETPRVGNAPRAVETERDARELLARWSAQNLLDVASTPPTAPRSSSAVTRENPVTRDNFVTMPEHRFDPPRPEIPAPSAQFMAANNEIPESSPTVPADSEPIKSKANKQTDRKQKQIRPQFARGTDGDFAHHREPSNDPSDNLEPSLDQDHVVRDALQKQLARRTNWSTAAGQLCAYAGVGLLTCGTVLVMWSYFGGPAEYMPKGWLTAAVGQMLLFLGVVTLISAGMEQTVHEVSWRIDHLAEEVYHMGLILDELEREHRRARRRTSGTRNRTSEGRARDVA